MATAMAMDAMIESLMQPLFTIEDVSSTLETPKAGQMLPALKSMILTPSNLCATCSNLLDREAVSPLPPASLSTAPARSQDTSFNATKGFPFHSLDSLAQEAIKGCHLCLVVYLALDSDSLRTFAQTMMADSISTHQRVTINPQTGPDDSIGFASFTHVSSNQANLSFEFVRSPSGEAKKAAKRRSLNPISPDSTVKTSLGISLDFANFESQRASVGYFFQAPPPGSMRSSISSQIDVQGNFSNQDMILRVSLTMYSLRRARELHTRTIPTESFHTASIDGLELAKSWIQDCAETHFQCNANAGFRWRPTHLLDVSIRDGKGNPGVKLVDGALVDRDSTYVTLSHSWGPTKPTRLHKKTEPALRQGVAQSGLPKTFADAALVTMRLGYRYLWIDALCIMHDDEQAVLNETYQMHNIYSNAVVNIAATCAWGDSEGFIRPRNVTALQPCVLNVRGHAIDDGTYMVVKQTDWDNLVDKAPLQKRAWALQERALSKRTLHFTASELIWECQQKCCSEVHPQGIPEGLKYSSSHDSELDAAPVTRGFGKSSHHRGTKNWARLVELFTAGRLSFASDKLLAVSGLAQQYLATHELYESDYLAGLWKPELPQSLLWKVNRGQRPPQFRAPTWSWASIDGPVSYLMVDETSKASCLDMQSVDLLNKHNAVFGLCQGAKLRVCGFLARGLLSRRRAYWGKTTCSVQFPRARVRVDFDIATFDEELTKLATDDLDVYVLPVVYSGGAVEGLLLVTTGSKGEFERLGTFSLIVGNNKANSKRFQAAMSSDFGLTSYHEKISCQRGTIWFSGSHKYVIDLI